MSNEEKMAAYVNILSLFPEKNGAVPRKRTPARYLRTVNSTVDNS